jgi:hypothetical protein
MDLWAYTHSVIPDFSRRGKPTDNATIDAFRWDYNEHHPHRALKGLSPREFAQRVLATDLRLKERAAARLDDLLRVGPEDSGQNSGQNAEILVSRGGIEPPTRRLRVCCSAN